jgi:hypothetical protein
LLGHWKDYNELEESLSMPELSATLKSMYKVENRKNKFMAAMQGHEFDMDSTDSDPDAKPSTFLEIQARAMAKMTGNKEQAKALEYGFLPEEGTGYTMIGDIDG